PEKYSAVVMSLGRALTTKCAICREFMGEPVNPTPRHHPATSFNNHTHQQHFWRKLSQPPCSIRQEHSAQPPYPISCVAVPKPRARRRDLLVRKSDARRGIRLQRRFLDQSIECNTSGYGDDDRHHTSDDERTKVLLSRTSQPDHHRTPSPISLIAVTQ